MRTLGYLLLLLFAFAIGLVGTVAASQALVSGMSEPADPAVRAVENETDLPSRIPLAYDLPTVEC